MAGRNGQELLSAWVPAELAAAFKAEARKTEGGASGALRRLVCEAVRGCPPAPPRGIGTGEQIGVRLKGPERAALSDAATARGTSPANWLRSLALVHLARRPQWTPAEVETLRDVFRELRAIGHGVERIARSLDGVGDPALRPGDAAREAAELIRIEMRRVVAVMTGNFDYWGLPDAERQTAALGAVDRVAAEAREAEARRRNRPRRRAIRYDDNG
ncbi:hypothetical protein [Azospirillum soli]|uniref:hypothetical protein n=1 Tax=Azospirillum soli TaxID=1304799 RepID=UPI001AE4EBF3|nr:hypothetical protein [Azospirillum soli]MBP2316080.1 hypothetical protein [Azospirillum soli]